MCTCIIMIMLNIIDRRLVYVACFLSLGALLPVYLFLLMGLIYVFFLFCALLSHIYYKCCLSSDSVFIAQKFWLLNVNNDRRIFKCLNPLCNVKV